MRKYFIDNIRWGTVVLVVLYHVIYMFNGVITDGVVGPITSFRYLDALPYMMYPWFMSILFIISGMCSGYYLSGHSAGEYIRARTRKLLVPSTVGLFVLGWLQGYVNMVLSDALVMLPESVPAFFRYLIMVVSGTGVLWTAQVLWVLSLVLVLVRKVEKGRLYALGGRANMAVLLGLAVFAWAAAQVLNTPVICVYRFGIYGFCFLAGYYVFSHEEVISRLQRYSVSLAVAAVLLGVSYTYVWFGENYAVEPGVNCPLAIAFGWTACLAVLGCAKRWGDRTNGFAAFMTQKSFGLYVFHYLPLSAAAYILTEYTQINAAFIYIMTALAAFAGSLLLYETVSRIPVLRWCVLGIKKEEKNHVQR